MGMAMNLERDPYPLRYRNTTPGVVSLPRSVLQRRQTIDFL